MTVVGMNIVERPVLPAEVKVVVRGTEEVNVVFWPRTMAMTSRRQRQRDQRVGNIGDGKREGAREGRSECDWRTVRDQSSCASVQSSKDTTYIYLFIYLF